MESLLLTQIRGTNKKTFFLYSKDKIIMFSDFSTLLWFTYIYVKKFTIQSSSNISLTKQPFDLKTDDQHWQGMTCLTKSQTLQHVDFNQLKSHRWQGRRHLFNQILGWWWYAKSSFCLVRLCQFPLANLQSIIMVVSSHFFDVYFRPGEF